MKMEEDRVTVICHMSYVKSWQPWQPVVSHALV